MFRIHAWIVNFLFKRNIYPIQLTHTLFHLSVATLYVCNPLTPKSLDGLGKEVKERSKEGNGTSKGRREGPTEGREGQWKCQREGKEDPKS